MSIQFSDTRQVFTLHTDRTTYQMKIGSYGYLMHLYYGPRAEGDMSFLLDAASPKSQTKSVATCG